jgi:hypothetical protein
LGNSFLSNGFQFFLVILHADSLRIENNRSGEDFCDSSHMLSGTLLVVEFRPHENLGVGFQVQGSQLGEVIKFFSIMLEVVVGEKAGLDVIVDEFSELQQQLILDHLQLNLSLIEVDNGDVEQLLGGVLRLGIGTGDRL